MNPVFLAETSSRVFYEFAPLLPITEWWHIFLFLLIIIAALAYVIVTYWKDSVELSLPLSLLLTVLRISAIAGLVFFFLNLEKRSEQRIVRNSRVALMIDTSLSMGLSDTTTVDGERGISRIDQVVDWLANSSVLNDLRSQHDVIVYKFADQKRAEEVASFPRVASGRNDRELPVDASVTQSELKDLSTAQTLFRMAAFGLVVAFSLSILSGTVRWLFRQSSSAAWLFVFSVLILVSGVVVIAASDLVCIPANILQIAGLREFSVNPRTSETQQRDKDEESKSDPELLDWNKLVQAEGAATYLSDSMKYAINKERDGPIAGIVLISDGRNNSGSNYQLSIVAARDAAIPLFTVGAGSNQSPRNVRVVDLKAPSRVFPGDKFKVTGLIQSFGFNEQQLPVELYSVDENRTEAETLEADGTFTTPVDGKPAPISFELQQQTEGTRLYTLRIKAPPADSIAEDNSETVSIEFIDRKQHVLLVAGGPSRDYRFLRNYLYRDPQVISHVFLQTAAEGADQEGDETLFAFPKRRQEWFTYDCIIAFDPDWQKLSGQQAKWLEQWVAEKAGGLIVIAGPINTPQWTRQPRGNETIDVIRRLYPVAFYNQATSVVKLGRFGGKRAFPLEFTRSGRAAEFLWLADTGTASQDIWSDSKGVYGYYAVSEPKPGAEIFARFSDEQTRIAGNLPIYLAGQFYGAGRVFFQASGEMWRMRSLDPEYFEQYYSKLIRWAAQGRLSRDSNRGLLLVDKEKAWIGDQVTVQAILRDAQDRPLALPQVTAAVRDPFGEAKTLELKRVDDGTGGGTYSARLAIRSAGKYQISLPVPESPDAEVLTKSVTATISDLEIGQPERNDPVLQEMADQTGGRFFENVSDVPVSSSNGSSPRGATGNQEDSAAGNLGSMIASREQETFLPGTTDREFTRRCMMWLLGLFTMVLCLEWTIRRLNRLA